MSVLLVVSYVGFLWQFFSRGCHRLGPLACLAMDGTSAVYYR